jgi:hypothetical protein
MKITESAESRGQHYESKASGGNAVHGAAPDGRSQIFSKMFG